MNGLCYLFVDTVPLALTGSRPLGKQHRGGRGLVLVIPAPALPRSPTFCFHFHFLIQLHLARFLTKIYSKLCKAFDLDHLNELLENPAAFGPVLGLLPSGLFTPIHESDLNCRKFSVHKLGCNE